jgi:hypothetical protein
MAEATDYWVDSILIPSVTWARAVINHHVAPFLILGGLKSHLTSHLREVFKRETVILIVLPAHASHLCQALDLCIFGVVKKDYKQSRSHGAVSHDREKLTQNIEWVLKARHRPCFVGTVLAAWTKAGFVYEWNDGTIQKIRVNPTLLASKLTSYSSHSRSTCYMQKHLRPAAVSASKSDVIAFRNDIVFWNDTVPLTVQAAGPLRRAQL